MIYNRSNKLSVPDFTDALAAWHNNLRDVQTPFSGATYMDEQIYLTENNPLFGKNIVVARPNQNAQNQLGVRLHFPASWVFSTDPEDITPDLRSAIVNAKFEGDLTRSDPMLWRTRDGGQTLRAVLTTKYSRYDHFDLWSAFTDALAKSGLNDLSPVVFRPHIDDHMTAYVIFPTVRANTNDADSYDTGRRDDGGLHPALYISNGEDGTASTRVSGGLYRSACENGCIMGWNAEASIRIRHLHKTNAEMAYAVNVALVEAMKSSQLGIENYVKACTEQIQTEMLPNMIAHWKTLYQVSEDVTDAWKNDMTNAASLRPLTLADAVNSLTLVAGTIEQVKQRENAEIMAGEILASHRLVYR